jgi:hypothetical protein
MGRRQDQKNARAVGVSFLLIRRMLCDALILSVATAVFSCAQSVSGNAAHRHAGEMLARKSHLINTTPFMKNASACRFLCALILGVFLSFVSAASAANTLNYQGRVISGGTAFAGSGQFKFALVSADGSTVYWKNDGTTEAAAPTTSVPLTVTKGIFSVRLGDTSFSNMAAISSSVFSNTSMGLRIWFNDGVKGYQQLSPDQTVSESALIAIRNSGASQTPEGSLTSVKLISDQVNLLKFENFVYRGSDSPTVSFAVLDAFTVETGISGTVASHTDSNFDDNGYITASSAGFQSLSEERIALGKAPTWYGGGYYINTIKTIQLVNSLVNHVEAEFNNPIPNGGQQSGSPDVIFYYSDGTSSFVRSSFTGSYPWSFQKVNNPTPAKLVSSVAFSVQNPSAFGAGVRNAKVAVLQSAQVSVALPSAKLPQTVSKFRIAISGARGNGDSIKCSLSDGVSTISELELATEYTWSGSSRPTTLTFSMIPAPNSVPSSTKIKVYGIFFE